MGQNPSQVKVRSARQSDAGKIAELAGQLGYPTTKRQMNVRLRQVLKAKDGVCLVAELKGEGVIGWVHASVTPLLEVERRAEVNGLVVDERVRSLGAGWVLLEAVEKWARKKKCAGMSVRSNVIRERAHGFYSAHGYEHYKTQKALRKKL